MQDIVEQYLDTAWKSLQNNVAEIARESPNGSFTDVFENSYDMTRISFPIGDTTIGGQFNGTSSQESGILTFSGSFEFYLRDEFADPLDIGERVRWLGFDDAPDIEVIDLIEMIIENIQRPMEDYLRGLAGLPPSGPQQLGIRTGKPYTITDAWSGYFEGQVFADPKKSAYFQTVK